MLDNILVPLEDVHTAEHLLSYAAVITQAFSGQLILLRVVEPSRQLQPQFVDPLDWHIRRTAAEDDLERLAAQIRLAGLPVQTGLLESPDVERIIQYANDQDIDLLVLGKQGENINDDLHKIMERIHMPALIVRTDGPIFTDLKPVEYRKILVPLDGSQRAECVLSLVSALAQNWDAQILLAHVIGKPEMPRRVSLSPEDLELVERIVERNRIEAASYLEQLQARLDGDVQIRLLVGENITATLHRLAEQENADLIVLSAHGYSGEPRWPYGSIANNIIAYSDKPVLLVQDLPREVFPTGQDETPHRDSEAH
jgi:nucleotide-binding universal stress UspA family protein